jgi:isoleucyl-tRNA synthetase
MDEYMIERFENVVKKIENRLQDDETTADQKAAYEFCKYELELILELVRR